MFNLAETAIYRALKREKIFFFRFAKILSVLSWILFIISLCLIIFSLWGAVNSGTATRVIVFSLSFYFLFYNFDLFLNLKIKKPELSIKLSDAILDPEKYNLAELLNFEAAKIAQHSAALCRKKKIRNNSTALLYSAVRHGKETPILCCRLGINIKKLQDDIKNYLEKIPKENSSEAYFLEGWEKTIKEALFFSAGQKHRTIGEKELLVGLAKSDEFFKKVLMDYDLKKEDVENLASWLNSAEDSFRRSKEFWTPENLARRGAFGRDLASGYTVTLDKFSIDWRRVVSKWAFKEIVGHEKEIEELQVTLAKSDLANALLVGESGTGRKGIIQALAQKCYLGQTLLELNGKRVVELDVVALSATIQDTERLEAVLDRIFSEVILSGNVILVIDQLENFVGLKDHKPGQVDISAILTKYLAIPEFQFVGITSQDGLHKNLEQNPSFVEFFRKIEVSAVNEIEAIKILQNSSLDLEYKNKIFILYPSIREIVNLTGRYMPSLPFPKKALDILNEAVVYVQSLKEKIVLPHHIAEIMSKKTEIPVGKMEVKEKEVLMNLENLIHQRIVNQEEAVTGIAVAMRRARAGIGSKTRPMGTFLFMGPTGVGKTETAKALAQIYFGPSTGSGQAEKMIRIDMSEFQAISDIPRLIGASSPVEMQGLLTTPVRETPFSLVLLDEIEKAHPDILNLFLQVLDEGHITDGQGRKIVFTNTIIICTSNAAASVIFKQVEAGEKIDKDKLLGFLFEKNTFRPEFINRFDAVVVFHPLTKDNLMKIAQLSLQSLQKSLKEKEIDFEFYEPLKEKIVELSYKPEFGAREMRRVVQDKIENVIAQGLISDQIKKGDRIEINPETLELIINNPAPA